LYELLEDVDLGDSGHLRAQGIVAGVDFTCALLNGGDVKCWGNNTYGQLGLGDNTGTMEKIGDEPNEIALLAGVDLGTDRSVSRISVGGTHVCALLVDNDGDTTNDLRCWGANSSGQLGLGDNTGQMDKIGDDPNEMGNNLDVVDLGSNFSLADISCGTGVSCGRSTGGELKCWGANTNGQLGQGDDAGDMVKIGDGPNEMGNSLSPIDFGDDNAGNARQVSTVWDAGQSNVCALLVDDDADLTNDLRCWGYNGFGQLVPDAPSGTNAGSDIGDAPGEMGSALENFNYDSSAGVAQVYAGTYENCIFLDDGELKCWGLLGAWPESGSYGLYNNYSFLSAFGVDSMGESFVPEKIVVSLPNGLGHLHGCALVNDSFDDGWVKCWGYNQFGQLGFGDATHRDDFGPLASPNSILQLLPSP